MIEIQETKDQNVINFFPGIKLLEKGQIEFTDYKSLRKSPFAENIFDIGGIKSILITEAMISITKAEDASWDELKPQVLAEIMEIKSTGELVIKSEENRTKEDEIKALINARIKPALNQDGGDIVFKRFENGIVYVELKGNCVGCPYALVTLKEGVEKVLKTYIPEVKEVISE